LTFLYTFQEGSGGSQAGSEEKYEQEKLLRCEVKVFFVYLDTQFAFFKQRIGKSCILFLKQFLQ
jgi:hypothetical protein